MRKELLIIHANCQGEILLQLLESHKQIAETYECRLYTNYIREPVPLDDLSRCSVFLYQHLGKNWGELASETLLRHLNKKSSALCIPSYYWPMCWPLQQHVGHYVLRDRLLEDLWARSLSREEFVHLATTSSLLKFYDIHQIVDTSLAHEKKKEAKTSFPYLDRILADHEQQALFYTFNHPGQEIMLFTANEILDRLGYDRLHGTDLPELEPYYTALELPVHPGVAKAFNLSWCGPNSIYNVYGHQVTYAQFAWLYAEYRSSGMRNFVNFMGMFTKNTEQKNRGIPFNVDLSLKNSAIRSIQ